MDNDKQRNLARVLAICVVIFGFGFMLCNSKGIAHYWIDESPGPDYVMYARPQPEVIGIWMIWVMVTFAVAAFTYFTFSPVY